MKKKPGMYLSDNTIVATLTQCSNPVDRYLFSYQNIPVHKCNHVIKLKPAKTMICIIINIVSICISKDNASFCCKSSIPVQRVGT